MAIEVSLSVERAVSLRLAPDAAFALLADVPAWGAFFPHVERVEAFGAAGPGAYRWEMAPLGPPGGAVRVVYACRYAADAAARTVVWTPVAGVGNGVFSGALALGPGPAGGTAGVFRLDARLTIPAPSFVRGLVVPAVTFEFGRMMDTFVRRLAALEP